MEHIQIIGGGNLAKAFTELGIAAAKVYQSDKDWLDIEYQVWEMPVGEFEVLEAFADEEWQADFGWYRTAGCNDTSELIEFNINGQTMLGFKNENSWYHSEDYLSELEEGENPTLPSYKNFTSWFSEYQGLSKPENVAYFATTLAEKNSLSKAEFFEKYQGSNEVKKISVASIIAFCFPPAEEMAKRITIHLFESRINHFETALKYCRHSKKRAYILKKISVLKPVYEQWREENVSDSD